MMGYMQSDFIFSHGSKLEFKRICVVSSTQLGIGIVLLSAHGDRCDRSELFRDQNSLAGVSQYTR